MAEHTIPDRRAAVATRNSAIIAQVSTGETLAAVAQATGLSRSNVCVIVKKHENETGQRLPRGKQGLPARLTPTEHDHAIVDAYREFGTFQVVAAQFGITRQRVHQIIARYERLTNEALPRTGHAIRSDKTRTIWRCTDCGTERRIVVSEARRRERCNRCHGARLGKRSRKHLTDELIADTISRVLTAERWHPLAIKAGYSKNAAHCLIQAVYLHLLRSGDTATIARIWPRGVPNWLKKKFGEVPVAEGLAA